LRVDGVLLTSTLLIGCNDIWLKDSYDVLPRQTAEQTLVVSNNSKNTLTSGNNVAPTVLVPGGRLTVRFRVNTIGTLKKPDETPYWTVIVDEYLEEFVETDSGALVQRQLSCPVALPRQKCSPTLSGCLI
jgi:hypothetical protein